MIRYFRPKVPDSFSAIELNTDNLQEVLDFLSDKAVEIKWTMTRDGIDHLSFSMAGHTQVAFPGVFIAKFSDGKLRVMTPAQMENFNEVRIAQAVSLMGSVQPSDRGGQDA